MDEAILTEGVLGTDLLRFYAGNLVVLLPGTFVPIWDSKKWCSPKELTFGMQPAVSSTIARLGTRPVPEAGGGHISLPITNERASGLDRVAA